MGSKKMRCLLDVHYGEDYCHIEDRTIRQDLYLLRKLTISLLKQCKVRTSSSRAMSKLMQDCLFEHDRLSSLILED